LAARVPVTEELGATAATVTVGTAGTVTTLSDSFPAVAPPPACSPPHATTAAESPTIAVACAAPTTRCHRFIAMLDRAMLDRAMLTEP